jgi:PAS domain S-box-containing protein
MSTLPPEESQGVIGRRYAEAFFQGLLEAAPDAIVIIDQHGRIIMVNKQTEQLFGYDRRQLIGQSVDGLLPARYRPKHGEHREGYLSDPGTRPMGRNLDLRAQHADGREFPVEISLSPLQTEDELFVISAIRDISDRKNAEETFQGLIESAPDAVVIIDAMGTIQIVNQQTEQLFGYRREELLGRSLELLLPERLHSAHLTHRARYIAEPGTRPMGRNLDLVARRKDGTEVPVEISLSPLSTEKGLLITSSIRDITEQKQLEAQLKRKNEELEEQNRRVEEASRLKSEFLANMSHELRTPLNAIIGFSELMHDGKVGPISPDHQEYLGDILTSSRHLMQLINDILDLAKVEAGKIELRPELVDMPRLVGEVRDGLRQVAAQKRIQLEVKLVENLGRIVIDPDRFKQVLYNYLSNALKFTAEGGQVSIMLSPHDADHFRLDVADTGIGIRAEDRDLLFVEFQQLDASSAKKYQGTGLGLALTKRLVEAQGGEVGVHSTPGLGSTFFAILPCRFAEQQAAQAEAQPAQDS